MQHRTITEACQNELRVKDSRFLAWLTPAKTRAHAEELIAERSRVCADASHNCFAYRVGVADQITTRASDAREPAGSAGRPMLQALEAGHLLNVAAVVSRYFGGTKLGIGGLIRAYGGAVRAAIAVAKLVPFRAYARIRLRYSYQDSAGVEKILRKHGAKSMDSDFSTEVVRIVETPIESAAEFLTNIRDITAGRISIEKLDL